MTQLRAGLATLALVAGLVLPTILPEWTNIAGIVLMVLSLLLLSVDREARAIAWQPLFRITLGAGLLLLLALIPTARSVEHIAAILILVPLWLVAPYAGLVRNLPPALLAPLGIGVLATLGAGAAMAVTGFDVFALGIRRGGWSVNNPIHLADLAVMLGFVSLVGLFDTSRWRFVVLFGPVFALAAIMFSGSRGPLLAFAPMAVIAVLYLGAVLLRPSRLVMAGMLVAIVAAAMVAPFITFDLGSRQFRIADMVEDMGAVTERDSSTDERIYMLRSAWSAFQASPLFGHGMIDYTKAAARYAPPDNPYPPSQHLHNDIANFAVIGGVLGLLCYLLLLLAPLAGGLLSRGPRRMELIYLGAMASSGYLLMGLTNTMLGILTQTMLYALMLSLIGLLGRDAR